MGPWIIILLAIVTITPGTALGQAPPSDCQSYKPAVIELHGTMVRKTFPGPPNYEGIRKGDTAETYWLLKLDSPVCVDEDKVSPDLNPAQKNIRSVQLVLDEGGYKKYREAVSMMSRIVVEAEANILKNPLQRRRGDHRELSIAEAICESVAHVAEDLNMRAIAVYTESGNTGRLISKYRPRVPIFAFAHEHAVCNRLNLYWGVRPVMTKEKRSVESMVELADTELLKADVVVPGEIVGIVAGTHIGSGSTNFIRLHRVVPRKK